MKTTRNIFIRNLNYLVLIVMIQFMVGCRATNATKGVAIGAGSGAVIGGIIGHQSDNIAIGAIIGAAVGGTTGAIIGHHMDKQAEELRADLKGSTIERLGEGIKITFDSGLMVGFDSSTLSDNTRGNLSNLARTLNKYDDTDILIEGHTDKNGSDEYNMNLSKQRSQAVAN